MQRAFRCVFVTVCLFVVLTCDCFRTAWDFQPCEQVVITASTAVLRAEIKKGIEAGVRASCSVVD
jgi:hypothetical protein